MANHRLLKWPVFTCPPLVCFARPLTLTGYDLALPLSATYLGLDATAGDLNCDGSLNSLDIDPFVLALTDSDEYGVQHPDCDVNNADCNEDGSINSLDIDPFVDLLTGG